MVFLRPISDVVDVLFNFIGLCQTDGVPMYGAYEENKEIYFVGIFLTEVTWCECRQATIVLIRFWMSIFRNDVPLHTKFSQ